MAIIAVAGGTGQMGRAVVDALIASGKHKTIILSRKENPALEKELGVPIIAVDYNNVPAVTKALEDNNVDTVISTIFMMPSFTGDLPKEVEIIRAANASKTTKRMISSDFSFDLKPEHVAAGFPATPFKKAAEAELVASKNLESTRIMMGHFMDYWGVPGFKSHFAPMATFIDIENNYAAIPGSGNGRVTMAHSTDVAKFIVASLDLQKWDPIHYIIGDTVTSNDLLALAEKAKGRKFTVVHDSVDDLKSGVITALPGQIAAYDFMPKQVFDMVMPILGLWFDEGAFDLENVPTTLNDKFPEIETIKAKDMIEQAWKKS
ncbi:unnamed protein product [Clonostachys rosea f. rosea IK726]|uniref:NmrA-like domain-containing protein n=2 Tax=Bionectria ochroleuca TaxID=29856 RepID=A0A0B7KHY2_BIOOC|nr:unnamed protein product [Clonostachys rosea f. rosea IK726]